MHVIYLYAYHEPEGNFIESFRDVRANADERACHMTWPIAIVQHT